MLIDSPDFLRGDNSALHVRGESLGAQKKTRTSTSLRTQAPEACASTNSAIWA
ncbi:hypothetical protein SACS_1396 [Parasaccharibacter apium]|uniref:Uncharacterized protein n=1 Tax=Parasaccharibacter apium TaxID=1510841 RepID=A0A7U7G6K2_9PROT|nr:hypothetical protein SACS_1396 [Parasaccharibacter apium]